MSIATILRRLTRRPHRRKSFYDSQHVMRDAVEAMGPVDMRLRPEAELRAIAENSRSESRRKAAEMELAARAAARSRTAGPQRDNLH